MGGQLPTHNSLPQKLRNRAAQILRHAKEATPALEFVWLGGRPGALLVGTTKPLCAALSAPDLHASLKIKRFPKRPYDDTI